MKVFRALLFLLTLTSAALAGPPAQALSDFGFRYFRSTPEEANVVCSPLSLHAAFAMLNLGAEGETRRESWEVLGLDEDNALRYSEFISQISPPSGQLSLASRVWPARSLKIESSYRKACQKAFGSSVETLNYAEPEAARQIINTWTKEKTEGLIEELIPARGIEAGTALTLSNALYFQSPWLQPFQESKTQPADFHTPQGAVQTPFLNGLVSAGSQDTPSYQAVSLPYADSSLAMAFVMPKTPEKWSEVRQRLSAPFLLELDTAGLKGWGRSGKTQLSVPKFRVSQESKPLALLRQLGLSKLLSGSANLSRLSVSQQLAVSECFHQAVVEIDEKGTKAAAATAITVTRSVPRVKQSLVFDKPFFFAIYHRSSGAPLFLGQVVDPRS